ncbi:ATP-dependent RNA helicase RhlB [Pseudomonas sp. TKO26]|uniref:ATP-dependent RNA helicase RhlB n=1 Tax=Pseudomonas saponiphila TaxID=556534 RepID=A0A1H4X6T8_9PSED|nr:MULTISPECIES: ATP-dependent RNA helicase RhlB [Pseudomonas]PYY90685.1 ATP-dependent RNA helicase RhlB [Pseudomonas sp. TKO30]PYY93557.1 ATP-dependent RNA helicase RhlB [Pseudomonas sp. TKO29]PYY95785.1 ATP-dependent RNA helicase RhlB [Pseudomonas sp. TKO26]PYZ01716.1 ATP-dependent RNA helicase RhlB [Pseudomonas sp. TKO14]SED01255.1 ATP-dependent RNA helicase RhlB [Pseudomonas saponiphila]
MTVLKALKKIFGKSEAEPLAPSPSAPTPSSSSRSDGRQPEPSAPATAAKREPVNTPAAPCSPKAPRQEKPKAEHPKPEQPRRPRAPKPPASTWKLEDFVVEPQEGKTRFHDFKLAPELMHAIQDLGFPYCTPIQAQVLGYTLAGKDAIGRAQTGTGKTAAFLISIITQLLQTPPPKERYMGEPRALIIAPTRELVVQIAKDAAALTKYTGLNVMTFVGGMDFDKQLKHLEARHCDILVATPGRLLDFNQRGDVHLDMVEVMVLDEADRMLDMGFIPQVRQIIRQTPPKSERQTLLFSATFTDDVMNLAKQWTTDPAIVEIEAENVASENVEQHIYAVAGADKYKLLYNLVTDNGWERVMVFANRKDEVRRIEERLVRDGVNAAQLSGDVPQHKRIKTLEGFREGKIRVLVATDVAGRGIHIDGISHVINFTLPEVPDDYVHRIGRTGRAGAEGVSISFAGEDDSYQLPSIEALLGRKISCEMPPAELLRPVTRKRPQA